MNKVIAFMLGATAGSLITWKLIEKKYKEIADEEIEAIREHYRSKQELVEGLSNADANYAKIEKVDTVEADKISYNKLITDLEYASDDVTIITTQEDDKWAPHVIAPEEFGEMTGYETKSWTYYADFVLADENDEIVIAPESIIGDGLEHFGEYEDDSVYVRNDNNECDYEILKHNKTFSEINSKYVNRDDD